MCVPVAWIQQRSVRPAALGAMLIQFRASSRVEARWRASAGGSRGFAWLPGEFKSSQRACCDTWPYSAIHTARQFSRTLCGRPGGLGPPVSAQIDHQTANIQGLVSVNWVNQTATRTRYRIGLRQPTLRPRGPSAQSLLGFWEQWSNISSVAVPSVAGSHAS